MTERKLNFKLPTLWADKKQRWEDSEARREGKRREEERRGEKRKSQKIEDRRYRRAEE